MTSATTRIGSRGAATNFNADQQRAVEHPGGPLLVLAGPGTGKTGVLVSRIAHLVGEKGVSPDRILALTFSRRAADEMSERVKSRVPEAAFVETRTFHSFALSVVRRHHGPLGLSMPPEIMATAEQWALVSEILSDESTENWGLAPGAPERTATVREVCDLLLRCQEHLLEPERMRSSGEKSGRPYLVRAAVLLERYRSRLGELSEVDYEGVIQYALRLLGEDGPVREKLVSSYDHVLVDEFQDTNPAQMRFVELLAGEDLSRAVVVGDDLQSIYAFTGAEVRNIQRFELAAGLTVGDATYKLSTNFRSGGTILELANHVACEVHPENSQDEPKVHSARPCSASASATHLRACSWPSTHASASDRRSPRRPGQGRRGSVEAFLHECHGLGGSSTEPKASSPAGS